MLELPTGDRKDLRDTSAKFDAKNQLWTMTKQWNEMYQEWFRGMDFQ